MAHPHEDLVHQGYSAFAAGDLDAIFVLLADDIVYRVPGRNPLSGTYRGHHGVLEFFTRIGERSGGTVRVEVLDVAANDTYAYVQIHESASRDGHSYDHYGVHVLTFAGKVVEFWATPRDRYSVDEFSA